jgi:Spy/CpxP family protein refolding chaperone
MRNVVKSSIAILTLALAGSVTVFAQGIPDKSQAPSDQPQIAGPRGNFAPGSRPHGEFRHHAPNPEFETRMLTRRLSLTSEQVAQIEPILAASHDQMKALRPTADAKPDFRAQRGQVKTILTETNQKVEAVLTPEQKEKFTQMHEHMRHGPHGDWKPKSAPAA